MIDNAEVAPYNQRQLIHDINVVILETLFDVTRVADPTGRGRFVVEGLATLRENLLHPAILFFFLGLVASLLKSDLKMPTEISKGLSLYLLIAIGFKGGLELARAGVSSQFIVTAVVAIALGLLLPVIAFGLLRRLVDLTNAAAIAAHYGSVSVVTFVTATVFLDARGIAYEPYLVAVLALMESPAIIAGVCLARYFVPQPDPKERKPAHAIGIVAGAVPSFVLDRTLLREAFLNASIVLLAGSFVVGFLSQESAVAAVQPVLVDPFQGVLALFLLDMGLGAGRRLGGFRMVGPRLALFGIVMPLLGGGVGAIAGALVGLSPGGVTLFAVLMASASYIAVPAAMRLALPEANPGLYLTLALAITFPFNVVIGIPIYHALAQVITGWI